MFLLPPLWSLKVEALSWPPFLFQGQFILVGWTIRPILAAISTIGPSIFVVETPTKVWVGSCSTEVVVGRI